MDARIAPPFMEATDASRLVCVVVVSYQEYALTHSRVSLSVKCGELRRACAIHNGLSQLTWQEIPVWDASQREDGLVEDGLVPAVRLTHTFGT